MRRAIRKKKTNINKRLLWHIWGHWNIHTENSGRKANNRQKVTLVVRFFCLTFSVLVD